MSDLACPFCAAAGTSITIAHGWEDQYGGSPSKPVFWMECRPCDARGPVAYTEEQARALWATRPATGYDLDGDNPETPPTGG